MKNCIIFSMAFWFNSYNNFYPLLFLISHHYHPSGGLGEIHS